MNHGTIPRLSTQNELCTELTASFHLDVTYLVKGLPLRKNLHTSFNKLLCKKKKENTLPFVKTNSCIKQAYFLSTMKEQNSLPPPHPPPQVVSRAPWRTAELAALPEAPGSSSSDKRAPVTSQGKQFHGSRLHSFEKRYVDTQTTMRQ